MVVCFPCVERAYEDALAISVIVNARDSAETIAPCVTSALQVSSDVVVLDMESSDTTAAIASHLGARVVQIDRVPMVELTRHRALSEAAGDWILILDADEVVPFELAKRLRAIAAGDEADVVRISFENYLFGAQLRFGSSAPEHDRHCRFFRRQMLDFPEEVHAPPVVAAGARMLEMPVEPGLRIVHFNYVDTGQFLQKAVRYVELESELIGPRPALKAFASLAYSVLRELGGRLVIRRGLRDGWRGVHLAVLMAIYRYLAHASAWERNRTGGRAAVLDRYRQIAQQVTGTGSGEPGSP